MATKKKAAPKKRSYSTSSHPVMPTAPKNEPKLARLRKLCLGYPGAEERLNHGRPAFWVDGRTFAMFLDDHHGDGRVAIWCKAPPGAQSMIVEGDPECYFVPPYVGPRGWIGARVDNKPDWDAITALVEESYTLTANKRTLAAFRERTGR